MQTTNTIVIKGTAAQVFALAAELKDWATILPHYAFMKVVEQSPTHKIADFGAQREFDCGLFRWQFPCRWRARQELFPDENRITFKHIKGITRGMWVEWRMTEANGETTVTIYHELRYGVPILGALFAKYVVGGMFVHPIASRTLRTFQERIEAQA